MGRGIGIGVRLLRPDVAAEEGVGHIQATAAWSEQFWVAEDRSFVWKRETNDRMFYGERTF